MTMAGYDIYYKALTKAGVELAGNEDLYDLKQLWKTYRTDYRAKTGEIAPSLYDMSHQQNDDIPTIDEGRDYIEFFVSMVETIYKDTMAYIWDNMDNTTHEKGQLPSLAYNHIGEIQNTYNDILRELRSLVNSGVPQSVIAQAIADNVELDYTIAVALQPPSDVIILFDTTLEQIRGIWSQINSRIEELQEQAERELW